MIRPQPFTADFRVVLPSANVWLRRRPPAAADGDGRHGFIMLPFGALYTLVTSTARRLRVAAGLVAEPAAVGGGGESAAAGLSPV